MLLKEWGKILFSIHYDCYLLVFFSCGMKFEDLVLEKIEQAFAAESNKDLGGEPTGTNLSTLLLLLPTSTTFHKLKYFV